jgi:putative transposase
MQTFTFKTGLILTWQGCDYRIERLERGGQILLQRISDGQLQLASDAELLTAYANGLLAVKDSVSGAVSALSTPPWHRPLTDLPAPILAEVTRRKFYLDWLQNYGDFVFIPQQLDPLLALAAKEIQDVNPPSTSTCYRWYQRLRANSGDIRALIPRFDRRGSQELKQNDRVLALAAEAIEEAYKVTPRATMPNILVRLTKKIQHENAFRLPAEHLVVPSKRTLYRLFERLEAYEKVVLREGQKTADRRLRITKRGPQTTDVLERVEVDHTPLDLFLIDDISRLPLGRPTLTIAIDHYSRMPLGYYLSFGGTSVAAVMGLLKHAMLPKQAAEPRIPSLCVENTWPCYGKMASLVLDNGMEFLSHDLESVALDLHIHLQFCPTRTPRFKGVVERFLKTINYSFAHQLPGTSLARFVERGEYDPLKHAVLTLAEFKHAFEKWLLDDYAVRIHKGIGTTPLSKWREGADRCVPKLPLSVEALQKRIGNVTERSLRHDGIWLHNIRYASDVLLAPLHRYGRGVNVRVVYDPDDLGNIQVWPPEQNEPIVVPAVHSEYANQLTLLQHQMLQQQLRDAGKQAENTTALFEARVALSSAISDLMNSRKQSGRKMAARLHGKNSVNPEQRFDAGHAPVTPLTPVASAYQPEDGSPPKVRYSFFTYPSSTDSNRGEK